MLQTMSHDILDKRVLLRHIQNLNNIILLMNVGYHGITYKETKIALDGGRYIHVRKGVY